MTDFPTRGQQFPNFWDAQLQMYIDERTQTRIFFDPETGWPARPTDDPDISYDWVDPTGLAGPPPGLINGSDFVISALIGESE